MKRREQLLAERETIVQQIAEITDKDHLIKVGQEAINKVFAAWPGVADWLNDTRDQSRKNLGVTSPTGRKRHLWAYLHSSPRVQGAMDRKGPNAVIQGLASEVACVAAHLGGEFEWDTFTRQGLPLNKRLANMVHDSQSNQLPFHLLPLGCYLTEHSMSTLPLKFYRDIFGFDMKSPSGIDIEYGFSDDKEERDKTTGKITKHGMKEWKDMRFDTLRSHLQEMCDEIKATASVRKAVMHNWTVIKKLREGELRRNQYRMDKRALDPEFWRKAIIWEADYGKR